MATWIPNSRDDGTAPVCYVPCLPKATGLQGPQQDAFPSAEYYMHYCTRMLVYEDVGIEPLDISQSFRNCYKTERFGDLGGYHAGSESKSPASTPGSSDLETVWPRYRFPATDVYLYDRDHRGREGAWAAAGFGSRTCAWQPGTADPAFWWSPDGGTAAAIEESLSPYPTGMGNRHQWNLTIIAWMWAGYTKGDVGDEIDKEGLLPPPPEAEYGYVLRDVSECDVHYMAFLF